MHLGAIVAISQNLTVLSGATVTQGSFAGTMVVTWRYAHPSEATDERVGVPDAARSARADAFGHTTVDPRGKQDVASDESHPISSEWARGGFPVPSSPEMYLDRASVDKPPSPIDPVVLSPPPDIGAGKMVLELLLSEEGHVDGARVEYSDLPEPFIDSVLASFRNVKFSAALRMGKPVPVRYRLQVSFAYTVTPNSETPELPTDVRQK